MIIDLEAMENRIADKVALRLERSIGDDILDTDGAACLLKMSSNNVLLLAGRGQIPARKVGGVWRFRRSALLNHISNSVPTDAYQTAAD